MVDVRVMLLTFRYELYRSGGYARVAVASEELQRLWNGRIQWLVFSYVTEMIRKIVKYLAPHFTGNIDDKNNVHFSNHSRSLGVLARAGTSTDFSMICPNL